MKLLRNSLYSMSGTIGPTLVSLATIPLFVSTIGAERYGILSIAWLVLGYFGAADFGIGRAITQRISSMQSEDHAAKAQAVYSALLAIGLFGLIGGAMVYCTSVFYFSGPFDVDDALRAEILSALWLLAICNPVVALSGVLSGTLMGLERFRLISIGNLVSGSALLLFPLATALLWSVNLSDLIIASLAARILGAAILAVGVWSTILSGCRPHFCGTEFRRLANFGAWIMVTALIGPFMVFADRLVIGTVMDAAAVAAYAIPFQIASRTQILPTAIAQVLFPRFASEEANSAQIRCRDFSVFVGQLSALVTIGLICLAGPLLHFWLGDALDPRSIVVAQILLAGFWINAVAVVPYGYIQARGNPRYTALLHSMELPFYILMLMWLGQQYGLTGFATAFALRCFGDCIVLCYKANSNDRSFWLPLAILLILVILAVVSGFFIEKFNILLMVTFVLYALCLVALAIFLPQPIRASIGQLTVFQGSLGNFLHLGRSSSPDRPLD